MEPDQKPKFECEFCGKLLGSQAAIERHKVQSVACLKLQNKPLEPLTCPWCQKKTFYTDRKYKEHIHNCNEKKLAEVKQTNNELQAENLSLKAQIAQLTAKLSQTESELIEAKNELILKSR